MDMKLPKSWSRLVLRGRMTAGKRSDGALSDPGCVLAFLVILVLLYAAPTDAAKRSNKDELERLPY